MKFAISWKLWNDLISAWWNKTKPCADVLFTPDGAIPELRGYWHLSGISFKLLQIIESLFWALFWRGHDFRMFLSVEVLRNLPFVQSRNRPFMLFSYSCIPNRRLRRSPHFQTSVSMVDLQAMWLFWACNRRWWLGSPFTRTSPSFCNGWRRAFGFVKKCEKVEREKTNGKGTDGVFSRFLRCAIFCLETKLKTTCIMVKVVWRIHKI